MNRLTKIVKQPQLVSTLRLASILYLENLKHFKLPSPTFPTFLISHLFPFVFPLPRCRSNSSQPPKQTPAPLPPAAYKPISKSSPPTSSTRSHGATPPPSASTKPTTPPPCPSPPLKSPGSAPSKSSSHSYSVPSPGAPPTPATPHTPFSWARF
jgi:hypothetical protein